LLKIKNFPAIEDKELARNRVLDKEKKVVFRRLVKAREPVFRRLVKTKKAGTGIGGDRRRRGRKIWRSTNSWRAKRSQIWNCIGGELLAAGRRIQSCICEAASTSF